MGSRSTRSRVWSTRSILQVCEYTEYEGDAVIRRDNGAKRVALGSNNARNRNMEFPERTLVREEIEYEMTQQCEEIATRR